MPIYESKSETVSSLSEDGHGISFQDLCDIIRARVEEIIRLILLELPRAEYETLVPAGLVLTGGGANLSGIEALGRDILQLPVRVGVASNIYGITDSLQDPAYSTGVGLLLWGVKHNGLQTWSHGWAASLRHAAHRLLKLLR